MRIFVVSDSHGRINNAIDAYKSVGDIDLIVHLGDFARDAAEMEKRLKVPMLSVRGNCDGDRSENGYRILETDFGKLFIAHGHMEGVKSGLQILIFKAESLGCKAALFGHTHKALYLDLNGFYLLNPGSITYPGNDGRVSFAVAELAAGSFDASILYR